MKYVHRKGRAVTDTQKRECIEDLLAAWKSRPSERLGQFLSNVLVLVCDNRDIFHIEDQDLVNAAFERVKGNK